MSARGAISPECFGTERLIANGREAVQGVETLAADPEGAAGERAFRSLGIDHLGALANALGDLMGFATLAYELIQNADDAEGASEIVFDARDDGLLVCNDGVFSDCDRQDLAPEDCPWTESRDTLCDFHSFRRIQGGAKRSRENTTGAFGIGFTAVYQVTDEPVVASGLRRWAVRQLLDEKHRISEQALPHALAGTELWLPWAFAASDLRQRMRVEPVTRDAPDRFVREVAAVAPQAMLFLKRVERLEIRRAGRTIDRYTRGRDEDTVTIVGSHHRFVWELLEDSFESEADALRAEHAQIETTRSASVAIAIPYEVGDDPQPGLLHAVLPTQHQTPLGFHINADFFPTTSRKSVVLEGDYQSEWNRAGLSACAQLLGERMGTLASQLEAVRIWQVLVSCRRAYEEASDGRLDDVFARFWERAAAAARQCAIVHTTLGEWRLPADALLPNQVEEYESLPLLEDLGIAVVDPDVRVLVYQLRISVEQELGLRELDVEAIVAALRLKGVVRADDDGAIKDVLRPKKRRLLLWDELERLLARKKGPRLEEAEREVATTPTAPRIGGGLCVWADAYAGGGQATIDLFRALVDFVDLDQLAGYPTLLRLARPFTASEAVDALATLDEAELEKQPRRDILSWFATRTEEVAESGLAAGVLPHLALFPSGDGFHPLSKLLLPGDFEDPLGITRLVDERHVPQLRQLLRALNARELTFATYVRDHIPARLEQAPLDDGRHNRLLELLASRLDDLALEDGLREVLATAPLVLCTDGVARAAGEVYFPTEEVTLALGLDAAVAAPALPAIENLYEWLGVTGIPRPQDVINRVQRLIEQRPTGAVVRAIEGVIAMLGRRFALPPERGRRKEVGDRFADEYGELQQLAWLPAERDLTKWYEPGDVYRRSSQYLFASQARFLGIQRSTENSAVDVLELLKVPEQPTTEQVVRHLLHVSQNGASLNAEIYTFLERRVEQGEDITEIARLRGRKVVQVDEGEFVAPQELFWSEHGLDPYRRRLATDPFSRWRRLLDEIGVKDEPDHEDAFAVMTEIARRQPDDVPLTDDGDERRALQRCWQILEVALAEGAVTGGEMRQHVGQRRVVINGASLLDLPRRVFVEDQPGLRDLFGAVIGQSCIARPRGAWAALRAAGVRGLREAAQAELVSEAPARGDEELRTRLNERREETTRILDAALDGQERADAIVWLQALAFASSEDLRVRWRLQLVNEELLSGEHEAGAVYIPRDQVVYVRRARGEVASWAAVAREIAAVICVTSDPTHIASQLKEVLAAASPVEAAAELDELGIPRLQGELPPPPSGVVARFGGDVEESDAEAPEAREEEQLLHDDAEDADVASTEDDEEVAVAGAGGGGMREHVNGSGGEGTEWGSRGGSTGERGGDRTRHGERAPRWIVLVSGESDGEGSERDPEQTAARTAVDEAGIAAVLEHEQREGRFPTEMPHEHPGYDVESRDEKNELVRLIEVKSISAPWDAEAPVQVTKTQFRAAQEHGALFWLYVVENAGAPEQRVLPIQDPAGAATRFAFDFGWKRRVEADGVAQARAEERELRIDRVRPLLDAIVDLDGPVPAVPYELRDGDGRGCWLEAAWPEAKVALVSGEEAARDALLTEHGWRIVRFEEAAAETVLAILRGNGDDAETA